MSELLGCWPNWYPVDRRQQAAFHRAPDLDLLQAGPDGRWHPLQLHHQGVGVAVVLLKLGFGDVVLPGVQPSISRYGSAPLPGSRTAPVFIVGLPREHSSVAAGMLAAAWTLSLLGMPRRWLGVEDTLAPEGPQMLREMRSSRFLGLQHVMPPLSEANISSMSAWSIEAEPCRQPARQ